MRGADDHALLLECGDEQCGRMGAAGSGADMTFEGAALGFDAGGAGAVVFGAGQGAGAGAVAAGADQVEAFFDFACPGADLGLVVGEAGESSVVADELDDEVDVVVARSAGAVVHGDPAAAGQAEATDDFIGEVAPLVVAEEAVVAVGGDRDVVDVPSLDVDAA
jgi:hypothetical protein